MLTLNLSVCFTLFVGSIFKAIFLGKLRDVEVEMLVDRLKYYVMEVSLALTIFRNELNLVVMAEFLLLLFLKSFHWLAKARLEYLEQILPIPLTLHLRQVTLMGILVVADIGLGYYCLSYTMAKGKSVLILFGFECGLLTLSIVNVISRYVIQVTDNHLPNGLRSKGLYIMLLDLMTDAVVFVTYVCFFCLVFHYYGLPLHIIRETWIAFTVFHRRLNSFIKYLRLLHNIELRFPDATSEEISAAGDCLVCREGFGDGKGKKLPCSHVFHLDCLRMWLQHQQTCPLCRADIPVSSPNNLVQHELPREEPEQQPPQQIGDAHPALASAPEGRSEEPQLSEEGVIPAVSRPKHSDVFPAFYIAVQEVPVCSSQSLTPETALRKLKKGAVVFVVKRIFSETGISWLQLNDGFVIEGTIDGSLRLMVPYQREKDNASRKSTVPYHLREIYAMLPQTICWSGEQRDIHPQRNLDIPPQALGSTTLNEISKKLQEISVTLSAMQGKLCATSASTSQQFENASHTFEEPDNGSTALAAVSSDDATEQERSD